MKSNANLAVFVAIFAFLLFVNVALPRQSDDFNHYYAALEGLKSAKDVYLNWNGRIGEMINNAFLARINPYIFDVLNASVGAIFVFLFFMLIFGRLPRDFKDIANIALILLMIMFYCAFGAVFTWQAGSVNYLWGISLIMLFLMPFRFYIAHILTLNTSTNLQNLAYKNHKILHIFYNPHNKIAKIILYLLFLILSFMAGMANEILGMISILTLIALNIFVYYRKKFLGDSYKIPIYLNIALLCFIAGYLCLYCSPGHTKRILADYNAMSLSQIFSLPFHLILTRFLKAVISFKSDILVVFSLGMLFVLCFKKMLVKTLPIFLVLALLIIAIHNNHRIAHIKFEQLCHFDWIFHIVIVLIVLVMLSKNEILGKKCDYFFTTLLLLFLVFCVCMLSSVQYINLPHRARFGDSMILIAMICLLFDRFANKHLSRLVIALLVIYSVFVAFSFVEYRKKWDNMLSSIYLQKQQGKRDIIVNDICFSRYKNLINWGCLGGNAKSFPNDSYAKWFNVDTITAKCQSITCVF